MFCAELNYVSKSVPVLKTVPHHTPLPISGIIIQLSIGHVKGDREVASCQGVGRF